MVTRYPLFVVAYIFVPSAVTITRYGLPFIGIVAVCALVLTLITPTVRPDWLATYARSLPRAIPMSAGSSPTGITVLTVVVGQLIPAELRLIQLAHERAPPCAIRPLRTVDPIPPRG